MLLLNKELESISDSSILCLVLSLALCCDMVDGSGRSFGCRDQWGGRGQTRRAEPTNGKGEPFLGLKLGDILYNRPYGRIPGN
ncbi:hypothetical protein TNCV_1227761 [Trichonephila clavipes]|nr:hypothetical protein TNCV_1227761 [Trichonephila clavipes]